MANRKISTTELDFDAIKVNLKTFLQGQTQFQDYDFEGAGLSILLDVLAYNTHYNALYTNLAVNEAFLDSASKRSSVVSLSKQLGYVPNSTTAATAIVDIVVSSTTTTPSSLLLPKYSALSTIIDGTTYNFYTLDDLVTVISGGTYTFSEVNIKEGTPLTFRYEVGSSPQTQEFIIPNQNVDLSTLRVRVQSNSTSAIYVPYTYEPNILVITPTSKMYSVDEIEGELYRVKFGNGILGLALETGNIVHLDYLTTNGILANSARTFSYQGQSLLGGIVSVVTTGIAFGGADIEDIESIRFNAPRSYTSQNRGVTIDDYKNIIMSNYTPVQSVNVWGGEDNDPPVYGKVFLCIKPNDAETLIPSEKDYIINDILGSRNIVSITPVIVDPNFIYISVTSSVYYNPAATAKSASDIKTYVTNTIQMYNSNNLQHFDSIFRISNLSSLIDKSENSIQSNITTIKLHRRIPPVYGISSQYNIYLSNPIYYSGVAEEALLTSGFYINGSDSLHYMDDDGRGNVRLFYYVGNTKNFVNTAIGTIQHALGIVKIPSLNITGLDATNTFDNLMFTFKPQSYDAISVRNQLVTINDEDINVNIIVNNVTAGGSKYTFASSRS